MPWIEFVSGVSHLSTGVAYRMRNRCTIYFKLESDFFGLYMGYPTNTKGMDCKCHHRDSRGQGYWKYDVRGLIEGCSADSGFTITHFWRED